MAVNQKWLMLMNDKVYLKLIWFRIQDYNTYGQSQQYKQDDGRGILAEE